MKYTTLLTNKKYNPYKFDLQGLFCGDYLFTSFLLIKKTFFPVVVKTGTKPFSLLRCSLPHHWHHQANVIHPTALGRAYWFARVKVITLPHSEQIHVSAPSGLGAGGVDFLKNRIKLVKNFNIKASLKN